LIKKKTILEKFEVPSRTEISHALCSPMCTISPTVNFSHQGDAFVTTDEATFTYHPKSAVYIMVHS
jgi:hypothetical protein